jgi:hypothetical protein
MIVSLDIYNYSVSTMNPQNEIRVIEYSIEESNNYFEKSLSDLKTELRQQIENQQLIKEYSDLISESNSVLNSLEQFRNTLFSDEAELRKHNKRFLKPYVKDEAIQDIAEDIKKLIQSYQLTVLDLTDRHGLSDMDKYIRKSLVFSELDFNQNSVVVYNNISRLQRDIRIVEREILAGLLKQEISNKPDLAEME